MLNAHEILTRFQCIKFIEEAYVLDQDRFVDLTLVAVKNYINNLKITNFLGFVSEKR
jgi:hypothetical protein